MKTTDFYYNLPEELIAQHPLDKRDSSRLMFLDGNNGIIEHLHFQDVKKIFSEGDVLVLNDTRVLPARLFGTKKGMENPVEVLLLKRLNKTDWETIVKPGRRLREGSHIICKESLLEADVLDVLDTGNRIVRFQFEGIWEEILNELGEMPLPPYIHEKLTDKERYQTVYSKHLGSAAAPTAGLHFTKELLEDISKLGVNVVYLTLHVGLGTFRPVSEENVEDHLMHTEEYVINSETCEVISKARKAGKRIFAVGTTSCRVLESLKLDDEYNLIPEASNTDIYIYPGYKFKVVDYLITNFHLPESSLIMLVSALAGRENILRAYNLAVKEKYRFFSFGDAMLIKANQENLCAYHEGRLIND